MHPISDMKLILQSLSNDTQAKNAMFSIQLCNAFKFCNDYVGAIGGPLGLYKYQGTITYGVPKQNKGVKKAKTFI